MVFANENDRVEIFLVQPNVRISDFAEMFALENNHFRSYNEEGKLINKKLADKLREKLPSTPEDIELEEHQVSIEQNLARNLLTLFDEMLHHTRYARNDFAGRGGTTYHFSLSTGKAGQTWSPHSESKVGRLVGITRLMKQAAVTGDQNFVEQIKLQTSDLLKELDEEKVCQCD